MIGLALEGLDLGSTNANCHAVFIFFVMLEFVDKREVLGTNSTNLIGYILNGIIRCTVKACEEVGVYMKLRIQFWGTRLNIYLLLLLFILIYNDYRLVLTRIPTK